jgi:hypothetical protein
MTPYAPSPNGKNCPNISDLPSHILLANFIVSISAIFGPFLSIFSQIFFQRLRQLFIRLIQTLELMNEIEQMQLINSLAEVNWDGIQLNYAQK